MGSVMIFGAFLSTFQILFLTPLFVFLIWNIQFHWKRRHLYKKISNIPGPRTLPFMGNSYRFFEIPNAKTPTYIFATLMKIFDEYFPLITIWPTSTFFFIAVQKPEHLEIVMNSPHCINKGDYFYKYMNLVIGEGLLSAAGDKWKKNRKIIQPAFNQNVLDTFIPIIVKCGAAMCDVLQEHVGKQDVDVHSLIAPINLDIICETAMGVQVNAKENNNTFGEIMDNGLNIAFLRTAMSILHYDFIFNLTWLSTQFNELIAYMKNFTMNIVVQKRMEFEERQKHLQHFSEQKLEEEDVLDEPKKRRVFLDHLLELTKENKFTDVELMDEVMIFTIAGSDTTLTTICFALTMLGMHPDMQQKVYEEIIDTLGHDRPITRDDMHKLKYMERFLKETLRLFPAAPFFARDVKKDVKLDDDYTIPEGATVVFTPVYVQRCEKYWEDPLKFDPDRFLPEEIAKRHSYSYIPFSAGPRNCIGQRFAMMSLKTTLSTILRRFVIKTSYKSVDEIVLHILVILRPTDGFKVQFEKRV